MLGVPFSDLHHAVVLIALALGYIVCYLAKREDKTLRILGYLIGTFIITISAVIILVNALLGLRPRRDIFSTDMLIPQHRMMRGQMPPAMPAQPPQKK